MAFHTTDGTRRRNPSTAVGVWSVVSTVATHSTGVTTIVRGSYPRGRRRPSVPVRPSVRTRYHPYVFPGSDSPVSGVDVWTKGSFYTRCVTLRTKVYWSSGADIGYS